VAHSRRQKVTPKHTTQIYHDHDDQKLITGKSMGILLFHVNG